MSGDLTGLCLYICWLVYLQKNNYSILFRIDLGFLDSNFVSSTKLQTPPQFACTCKTCLNHSFSTLAFDGGHNWSQHQTNQLWRKGNGNFSGRKCRFSRRCFCRLASEKYFLDRFGQKNHRSGKSGHKNKKNFVWWAN